MSVFSPFILAALVVFASAIQFFAFKGFMAEKGIPWTQRVWPKGAFAEMLASKFGRRYKLAVLIQLLTFLGFLIPVMFSKNF